MSSTTAELEAKLRQRMQKCEGSNAMSPKRGHRVWSDEMAKTVSQQRRARLSTSAKGGARGNPQDVEGVDMLPRSISSSSASSSRQPHQRKVDRNRGEHGAASSGRLALFGVVLLAFTCLAYRLFEGNSTSQSQHELDDLDGEDLHTGWRSLASQPQEAFTGRDDPPMAMLAEGDAADEEDASTSDAGNTQAESDFDFRAVVKEAFVASHGPFVTVDTRRRGDASDDWRSFLEQHSALEQVYEVGKVTFSKRASRISSVTLNVTLTNTGTTPWSSAVLRAVHGSDMGILSLPLGVVVEPGSDHKISLRLRLPQADEDAVPTSMWALSIDDRVFGPLLLLELEQEEDAALGSLLAQAQESAQKKQEASAHVFDVPQMFLQDEALREDRLKVRDVSEDWAGDLAKTGMSQAYRIGSITVTKSLSARMAPFQLLVHLTNTGLSDWPEGTGLRLVSGRSLGCELLPLEVQVSPGSKADVLMALQVSTEEDPEEMVQDTVWALADDRQFFGPLLILELSHSS